MEGNLSSGESMMQRNSPYGGFDLQGGPGPIRVHHHRQQQQQHHGLSLHPAQGAPLMNPVIHESFPLTIGTNQDGDRTISLTEYNKLDNRKSGSDDDEPSNEDAASDLIKGKKASTWHRVKWTDTMVQLLITAVSYISEEASAEYGGGARRKYSNLQKKGKWKSVSKVMAERGHFVSPQQCEDKFNDLNKRYKRLNEILGRGTSCEVVENPVLLDVMDHISDKSKDEVRKILSSKHLHYEEMCSYHNGNRLHLPADPELQHSLRLALRCRDDHDDTNTTNININTSNEVKKRLHDDNDDGEQDSEFDGHDESEENDHMGFGFMGAASKRMKKQCQSHEGFSFGNNLNLLDCNKSFSFHGEKSGDNDVDKAVVEGGKTGASLKEWIIQKNFQLDEQRLHIQEQMLELEKEKFEWQRFSRKKDRELESTRMEIERMKLENERMALELRQKEMDIGNN